METSSLPLHFDPYSFNIKEGDNSLCLHTRENEYRLWESCQDLQGEKAESYFYWFRPTADKLKAIDLKITQGYDRCYLTKDSLDFLKLFLYNEQFIKTLHVQNWSWKKERESIFDMTDFNVLISFFNELDLTDHNVKLEIVNKENYIFELYGKENAYIHFQNNLNRYLDKLREIKFDNFFKIDFFHYFNSDLLSCWIKLKLNDSIYDDIEIVYYDPTEKKVLNEYY